jgi:hypothetical protein
MHLLVAFAATLCGAIEVQSGSLIFLENSDKIVDAYTRSRIDHVAIVLRLEDQPWVYEATPPRVRRISLARYYNELAAAQAAGERKVRVWLVAPADPFSVAEIQLMRRYLDRQLGRRYSVRGYVRDKEGDGIHCAELAANSLSQCGRIKLDQCYNESPASLLANVGTIYLAKHEVQVPTIEPRGSWCQRWRACWSSFASWCGWSCREAWTFCR